MSFPLTMEAGEMLFPPERFLFARGHCCGRGPFLIKRYMRLPVAKPDQSLSQKISNRNKYNSSWWAVGLRLPSANAFGWLSLIFGSLWSIGFMLLLLCFSLFLRHSHQPYLSKCIYFLPLKPTSPIGLLEQIILFFSFFFPRFSLKVCGIHLQLLSFIRCLNEDLSTVMAWFLKPWIHFRDENPWVSFDPYSPPPNVSSISYSRDKLTGPCGQDDTLVLPAVIIWMRDT